MTIATGKLLSGSILDEQIKLEERSIQDGVARYQRLAGEAIARGDGASLKPAERCLVYWFGPLVEAIRKDQKLAASGKAAEGAGIWGPVFSAIGAEELTVITLHEMIGACMKEPGGVLTVGLANSIGRAVLAENAMQLMREKDAETRARRKKRLAAGEPKKLVYEQERELVEDLTRRFRSLSAGRVNWWAKKSLGDEVWSRRVCAHIGARLIYQACEVCNASFVEGNFRLAWHRRRKRISGKDKGIVVMDDNAIQLIDEGHDARQHLRPRYQPMIVPPYPFTTDDKGRPIFEGGYAKIRTPFISKPTKEQKKALQEADLTKVCQGLSAISRVALRINDKIAGVQQEIWLTGGGELGIPHKSNLPHEPKPAGYKDGAPAHERWKGVDKEVKKEYKRRSAAVIAENIQRIAMRQEYLAKRDIAQRFRLYQSIYFPHQFCFRGRLYAIPVHLNYQGDDVCRSLIEFARGKPADMDEIKIHAASVYGVDKVSFEDRIKWVDDHIDEILASADDPLNETWWMHADESTPGAKDGKPWQFLAACFALADPEAAEHLPVQTDGTCNGLQWYCALGRDEKAAPALNMVKADKPNGVYSIVGDETNKIAYRDAVSNPTAASLLARVGNINKPLVKSNVMTTAYGVTNYGARRQASDELKKHGFEGEELYSASMYLKDAVMRGIGEVCKSAVQLMEWIRTCAGLVAAKGRLFTCTSPDGFPMVQPYRSNRAFRVKTVVGEIDIVASDETMPVAKKDQVSGSAPNIIHMLDGTHLRGVGIECQENDTDLIPVHDAYSTHSADMKWLRVAIRRVFVEINKEDLPAKMVAEWRSLHPDIAFPDPPAKGSYDILDMLDATYAFH